LKLFHIELLEEAYLFLNQLSVKERQKIYHVLHVTRLKSNSYYFNKVQANIWEFRLYVDHKYYRLLAFKTIQTNKESLVTITHGFVKKTNKIPFKEILKAARLEKYCLGISKIQLVKDSHKLEKLIEEHIGARGTKNRSVFEQQSFNYVLGQQVKEVRKKRALSQVELGNLVGVQKAQISKIENGKNQLRIDTLFNVLSALNADLQFSISLRE
jgi:DNA-binding XRE family transcriptional regulator/phage-related protein